MANPWNLANMTEEKRLKNTFIVATLCSTLISTFSSSIGLWDRVSEKRRQKQRDTEQDNEIRRLQEKVTQAEKHNQTCKNQSCRSPHDDHDDYDNDDLSTSLERSEALIRKEYDESAKRLGKRFAVGDIITENQLQAQIITLQQTVIDVLQEALLNRTSLSCTDVQKLISASAAARNSSLGALREQYQRLSLAAPLRHRALPDIDRRQFSDVNVGDLFCKYSLALQDNPNLPLSSTFASGGGGFCPCCGFQLDTETSDTYWHIEKRVPALISHERYDEKYTEKYHFNLGQRFIIKCHTEQGEYACVLCREHRSVDVVCRSVPTLVNHVGKTHNVSELRLEPDLKTIRV
ncbi:hypothetical protein F5Y19DRAFT_441322 [Xylariaceae sp. FL1651]|nr:hypothetical protein F5Y19DRAFT_441322 [Xylariaceae sp. FL1651]